MYLLLLVPVTINYSQNQRGALETPVEAGLSSALYKNIYKGTGVTR